MRTALWLTVGLLLLQEFKQSVSRNREKRSVVDMILTLWCYRDRLKIPLLALNQYGCHCGAGGSGKALDAVDRCCFSHDCCYRHARLSLRCHHRVKWQRYKLLCKATSETECGSKSLCGRTACECDKQLAECLTAAKPQRKHSFYNRELCQGPKGTCPIVHGHNRTEILP